MMWWQIVWRGRPRPRTARIKVQIGNAPKFVSATHQGSYRQRTQVRIGTQQGSNQQRIKVRIANAPKFASATHQASYQGTASAVPQKTLDRFRL
jgi:hypothetical protein